ncbi:MAG: bifunctional phosphoribosyl-AMP cyclohydrolase/phosphoribosyl-ATP diphosphatase HisIE [Calditrichaceae bacterium]|nr:bifunctional phosphoribosyl-AMP cyclohydrolase/phosphoribosyl-ATP diphosphatase HisIE [Calditrichaceae bacterium]
MKIDFEKGGGLVPAIVQDYRTNKVLMLGYMNEQSLEETKKTGKVTFYSRSRKKLWTKGETSNNYLFLKEIIIDCDGDTLLVKADPAGPVCHTGADTCFSEVNANTGNFLYQLENIIRDRQIHPKENSYTNILFSKGVEKIAQKVGEEATEVVIEGVRSNIPRLKEETADLLYHLLALLRFHDVDLDEVFEVLEKRHVTE